MIYAQILAGGVGKRMGNSDLPKQFLLLGSKPIIIHTIEQFLLVSEISEIIIGCPKDWINFMNDLLKKYINTDKKITVIEGGPTRNETIMNACNYIEEKNGLSEKDIIITHDAVRPFVDTHVIKENIKKSKKCDAVDTIIPVSDTIVEVKNKDSITSIPIRDNLYIGQTPQTFNIKKLIETYKMLTKEEKEILTDACKIFVLKNKDVSYVNGSEFNIKITTMYDLKIANAILEVGTRND